MHFKIARITEATDYILTALLLIIATVLLISRNENGINNLRKASITLFSYIQEPLSDVRVYRQALKTNNDLRKQNILLLDKLNQLRSAKQQNEKLRGMLHFSQRSDLNLYPVQVIGKELNQINNLLTIDAGSQKGITEGMPLVSANGLIGQVILTADDYAQVMPYFNTLFRVSAKLQNTNAYGIVVWSGENINMLELKYVPRTVSVDTGEVVLTSGYSHKFPPNIPIGKVVDHKPNEGKDTQQIFIHPFVNLYTITEGFIITNKQDSAIKALDKRYQQLFK